MPELAPVDAFYLTLDETPGDLPTLLALADWYLDHDQPAAGACIRWTVQQGYRPFRYLGPGQLSVSGDLWSPGWLWWAIDDPSLRIDWGHPAHCCLPPFVWDELSHSFPYDPAVFKQYPTTRAAYEALIDAWPRLEPIHRPRPRREKRRR